MRNYIKNKIENFGYKEGAPKDEIECIEGNGFGVKVLLDTPSKKIFDVYQGPLANLSISELIDDLYYFYDNERESIEILCKQNETFGSYKLTIINKDTHSENLNECIKRTVKDVLREYIEDDEEYENDEIIKVDVSLYGSSLSDVVFEWAENYPKEFDIVKGVLGNEYQSMTADENADEVVLAICEMEQIVLPDTLYFKESVEPATYYTPGYSEFEPYGNEQKDVCISIKKSRLPKNLKKSLFDFFENAEDLIR